MMEKTFHVVNHDAPGSLITDPPDPDTLAVRFSEAWAQEDGRGWVAHTAPGVTHRFFKQGNALLRATAES
jgi:hypothetical protein